MIPITGDSLGMRLVPLVHLSVYDMQTRNDVCACLLEQVFSCVFLMYTHAHTHTHTHTQLTVYVHVPVLCFICLKGSHH